MRRILWIAALVGFVAFQVYWFGRVTPTERQLATVAESIAGQEVEVRCPSIWRRLTDVSGFKGTATIGGDGRPFATLAHDVCKTFEALPERGFPADLGCLASDPPTCDAWTMDVIVAVHVLSHESWHLRGVGDEGMTECFAWQTDAEVARYFGADVGASEQMAMFLAARGDRVSLPQYRPPAGCNPGGRLDIHPETAGWPS
jgi:hypothetical protein